MKYTYILKEILKSENNRVVSYAIVIIEQPTNRLYFTADSTYLSMLVNKYNDNQYISVYSALERIAICLNILVNVYGEDFNTLTNARLYSELHDLNMLAGNMCKDKFIRMLNRLIFEEKYTQQQIDIKSIF